VTSDYFALSLTVGANTTVLLVGKGTASDNFGVGVSGLTLSGITAAPGTTYSIVAGVVLPHGPIPGMQLLWVNPDGSDFYNTATGANSADAVAFEPVFFNAATVYLYSNLAGVGFDDLILCDAIEQALPSPCPGDINGDGDTNAADFVILAGNFGAAVPPNTGGDLNGDGVVNAADFVILAGDFGCS
jgi:hypothetical protein